MHLFRSEIRLLFMLVALFVVMSPNDARARDNNHQHALVLESASELDYPPFALVLEDGTADGFAVELLRATLRAVGLKVHFEVGPWHEIKKRLINGELDVLPLVSFSPERDHALDFSAPYLRLHGGVFVREGETSIRSEADLRGREVITMRGDNAHEYALKNKITDQLILTDSYAEALQLLSSGQHDAVLMPQLVGLQLIEKLHIDNIVSIHSFQETDFKPDAEPLSGYEQKFCFAVQEGDKELLSHLNEGLAIVIANGTYNALYNQWFGPLLPRPQVSHTRILKYLALILFPTLLLAAVIGIWFLKKQVAAKTRHLKDEIQEREQVEKTLQKSEHKFRTLFKAAAIPMCYVNSEGVFLDFNAKFTEIFGYTSEDIPTVDQWFRLAYPDAEYRQWVVKTWEAAVARAKNKEIDIEPNEYRVTCKNGEVRKMLISGTFFQDSLLGTFVDITDLKIAEERFEKFFTLVSDIFCIADIDGHFRLINPAATQILGYSQAELLEKPFLEFIHPDDKDKTIQVIQEKLERGDTVINFLNRYICKDGSVKWLEWMSHPVPDQGVTYAVGRDCTARLQAEKDLKEALTNLERSNAELQQFAYAASHDLQEPLRSVAGFLQLLESRYGDQLDQKGRHYIERAVTASHRMQQLINDLLALSRVSSQETSFEPTDLNAILEEALENLQPIIEQKNAKVNYPELPVLDVDKTQIQSLFQNLIGNALKYNQSHAPCVDISCQSSANGCRFTIRDNGIGISPKFYEKIFMIFQRLHARRDYSGSGIGLALCKKIVERHGGSIWVESAPDQGSIFYFTLFSQNKKQ